MRRRIENAGEPSSTEGDSPLSGTPIPPQTIAGLLDTFAEGIYDTSGTNTLVFGGGIDAEALTVSVVTAGQAGATQSAVIVGNLAMGKVGIGNGQGGAIAIYQFADGQRFNHVDFLGNFAATPVGQVTSLGGRSNDTLWQRAA